MLHNANTALQKGHFEGESHLLGLITQGGQVKVNYTYILTNIYCIYYNIKE